MRKLTSFAAFFVACIVLIMVLLPLAFNGKAARFLQNKANEYLLAEVSFKSLSLNLFTDFPDLSVSIPDLIVVGVDSFANDTLVKSSKIKLTVNIKSLLTEEGITIKKIMLTEPQIYARVLPDGRVNWDIMRPDTSAVIVEDTSIVRLHLKEISIKDAKVTFDNQESDILVIVKGWNGSLKGNMAKDRSLLSTNSSVSSLSFAYNKIPVFQDATINADMSLDADFKNSTYTLKTNSIKLNAMDVSLDGSIQFPDTATTRFDLRLNTGKVTFKQFLSLIPGIFMKDFETIKTSGDIKLSASMKGDMIGKDYPSFDVMLSVDKGFFQYPSLPESVSDIDISAHLYSPGGPVDNARADISKFHFNMAGNLFDLVFALATPVSDPDFKLKVKGIVDLGAIKKIYPLEKGTTLNGRLQADASAAGRKSYIDKKQYGKFSAQGNFSVKDLVYKTSGMPDVKIMEARMYLNSRNITLDALSLVIGKNDFQANGKLINLLSWFISDGNLSGNLNVTSSYLNLNDFMKKDSLAVKDTLPILAFEIPKNLDLGLSAKGKTVQFSNLVMKDVLANMTVKNGRVTISNLSAKALGGSIFVNGYYESTAPQKPEVSLGLNLQKVTFAETFKTFNMTRGLVPVFEKTKGDFSLKMQFSSTLNKYMDPDLSTLTGNGLLQSQNVRISGIKAMDLLATTLKMESLKNIALKDLKIPFKISDGKVKTSPFTLNIGGTKLDFEGSTGIDKTIDYAVKVSLPSSLSNQVISSLKGTITGTFSKPVLKLDTEDLARQAITGFADQLLKKTTGKNVEETVDKAKEDILKKAEIIRAKAKAEGDMLIQRAEIEGNKLIEKANNPILKAAAKLSADQLKIAAKKKAAELEAKAKEEIKAIGVKIQ